MLQSTTDSTTRPGLPLCPHCGREVLSGRTDAGKGITLDCGPAVYALAHVHADGTPRLVPSRGYVEHTACCAGAVAHNKRSR